jgi:carbon-monoxide dehydrogenase small subunit
VLLDGAAVVSCLVPVAQAAGRRVATVESLGRPARLSPLQEAFLAEGAAQCGICTPGMLMTAAAYLQQGGKPDAAAIRRELAGNLCRCTGYQHIVRAVQKAARRPPRSQK